jgi:hypothetical protein
MVGTALTVLLVVCTIAGMILQKQSKNSSRSLPETVQGPVALGEEYLKMERSTVAHEEKVLSDKRDERTEVNYEVTASDNLNSDSYGGEYNGRDTFMSIEIIDTERGEQMSHAGTKKGNKHIIDQIMMHGSD